MCADRKIPLDPLAFIRECVNARRIFWTYHVNMRLRTRGITRQAVLDAAPGYEVIASYPEDRYLPSYLVFAQQGNRTIHILCAADTLGGNVRVITAYAPDPGEWDETLKRRRKP